MFQATKWSWKRVAARLLLVPVLAGGPAAVAHAQATPKGGTPGLGQPPLSAGMSNNLAGMPTGDPKALLKGGRAALAAGKFDEAQDLARRAEANNPSGKWGLFDDTPNSLLKDVDSAREKDKKVQAEKLYKVAKDLFTKKPAGDAERAYNLDTAYQMARKADYLHGPYSMWDMGDRPDKLVKEIEQARAKMKPGAGATTAARTPGGPSSGQMTAGARPGSRPTPAANPKMPAGPNVAGNMPVAPAGGPLPPVPGPKSPPDPKAVAGPVAPVKPPAPAAVAVVDGKKAEALKLLDEGKKLHAAGDFGGAKVKYAEADKLGATFAAGEYSPQFAMQELSARGADAITRLMKEAETHTAKKDYAKAEAALNAATEIAAALSLFPRPIEEAKSTLRLASSGQYGGLPPGGLAPAPGVEVLIPTGGGPVAPVLPSAAGVASIKSPTPATPAPAPTAGNVTGRQLLDQAELELRKGDLEMANKLAVQAHNLGGSQEQARGLLNQIDAEAFNRKKMTAEKSFAAAVEAHGNKDYGQALGVLVLIDPQLLTPDKKHRREELVASCRAELGKGEAVVAAGGQQPAADPMGQLKNTPEPAAPGTARIGDGKPASPDSYATQADALRKVQVQKLRTDGLKIQADAQAAFGRGDTDAAIQLLIDYQNKVRSSGLPPAEVAMLLRQADSRLEMFRVMKGQADAIAREKKEKRESRELIVGRGAAEEQRKAEVQRLTRQFHALVKESKFKEAEAVALQAKQLEPDDAAIAALAHMAKVQGRVKEAERIKDEKERFVLGALNNADTVGPLVTANDPVAVKLEAAQRSRNRGSLDDVYLRSLTPATVEIERKLEAKIDLEYNQVPLSLVIENLRDKTGVPFTWDESALDAERISRERPVSEKLGVLSVKNFLNIVLEKAELSYVIEHDVIKITTTKRAKGRLFTKVFSVADLVTPVPNFALPDYANFEKMLNANPINTGRLVMPGLTPGMGGGTPAHGLGGGAPVGATLNSSTGGAASAPGIAGGGLPFGPGGNLRNEPTNPLASSAHLAPDRNTKHEQLIKLITGMVRPYAWDGMGGAGRVEYFDLGSALVVNQTADVIQEVANLLDALRRLQDLAMTVEVRVISLSETFFERMGMDFAVNVKTSNTSFEPNINSGVFRPEPFINDINRRGSVIGITPAGAGGSGPGVGPNFTPDLDVPIRSTSFQYAIPGFGGYPNSPGFNGGVSLGLAFLNDIQVYMFMEAAQGDSRINVMQAPKLTLFNGQTSTITIQDTQFFVTNVQVISVNGQLVFIPTNSPLPGPNTNIALTIQGVVSADRRFVRLNLPVTLSAQAGATVPLFPITTFITPVFEGGSQGVPIPFTQFLQQPAFTTITVNTTVVCPDGGTVLLGGLKTLGEGRNEFGPPFLSKIPYLNRLFKNVGIGRETRHIMLMVTPRIIINAEEEINQTEGRPGS